MVDRLIQNFCKILSVDFALVASLFFFILLKKSKHSLIYLAEKMIPTNTYVLVSFGESCQLVLLCQRTLSLNLLDASLEF